MSDPQSVIAEFFRGQFGHPSPNVERVIQAFADLAAGRSEGEAATAPDEVLTRLAAVEAAIESLRADIAPLPAAAPAVSIDEASVTQRLDAIDRAYVALQGSISKLEAAAPAQVATADTTDAIHRRLAALEARPAAPARAAAPAARPAAASA